MEKHPNCDVVSLNFGSFPVLTKIMGASIGQ